MLTIADFERQFGSHVPQAQEASHLYAVLVPLVELDGQLHLLFEVRADTMQRQPNEVCFPGGKMEPGETAQACALRETAEELGIPASSIRVIGPLDYIAHYTNYILYPILAQVDARAIASMRPNPAEVKDTFLAPLSFFQTHPPRLYSLELVPSETEAFPYQAVGFQEPYRLRSTRVVIPIYDPYQGYTVWGVTGRIVRWMLQTLEKSQADREESKP